MSVSKTTITLPFTVSIGNESETFSVPEFIPTPKAGVYGPALKPWESAAKRRSKTDPSKWVTFQGKGFTFVDPGHISEAKAQALNIAAYDAWVDSEDIEAPMPADVIPCTKGSDGQYLCDCEAVLQVNYVGNDGRVYKAEVPTVELVAEVDDREVPYFETVLTPFGKGGALLNDETSTVTFGAGAHGMRTYEEVERVWLDGQEVGIEVLPEASVTDEFLPVFSPELLRLQVGKCAASGDGKYGICSGEVTYRDVALQSRSETDNQRAFVAALFEHQAECHPYLTAADFCEHGQRKHVVGTSKSGARWEALFCKRGQSRTACAPVWVND